MSKEAIRKPVQNPRGPREKALLPRIKIMIASRVNELDKKTGKKRDRYVLANEIIDDIKSLVTKDLLPDKLIPPAEDTVVHLISKYRNTPSDSPLDQPWSLGSMDICPIPFDILRIVLFEAERSKNAGSYLTIREARWISRLSVINAKDKGPERRENETNDEWDERIFRYLELLAWTAIRMTVYEYGCELAGLVPVNTSHLDASTLESIEENLNLYYYGTKEYSKNKNGEYPGFIPNELHDKWKSRGKGKK